MLCSLDDLLNTPQPTLHWIRTNEDIQSDTQGNRLCRLPLHGAQTRSKLY